jgi:hypothetical protein
MLKIFCILVVLSVHIVGKIPAQLHQNVNGEQWREKKQTTTKV